MRTRTLLSSLVIGAGMLAGAAFATPPMSQSSNSKSSAGSAHWLSTSQVRDRLDSAGYRSIERIERYRDRYEVEASDRDGRRVELYVDPVSAEIIQSHDRSSMSGRGDRRSHEGRHRGSDHRGGHRRN